MEITGNFLITLPALLHLAMNSSWKEVSMSLLARLALLLAFIGALSAIPATPAVAQETTTISVGDFWFCSASFEDGVCETTVTVGDTVVWNVGGASAPHTTTDCGASCDNPTGSPLWDSGVIDDGATFQSSFSQPGTYLYYCQVHPFLMRGRIIVQAAPTPPPAEPTATQPPGGTETPGGTGATATPAATEVSGAPDTGAGPQQDATDSRWALVALAAMGIALVGLGAAGYRGARRER